MKNQSHHEKWGKTTFNEIPTQPIEMKLIALQKF
jgi:hypothetical protein